MDRVNRSPFPYKKAFRAMCDVCSAIKDASDQKPCSNKTLVTSSWCSACSNHRRDCSRDIFIDNFALEKSAFNKGVLFLYHGLDFLRGVDEIIYVKGQ